MEEKRLMNENELDSVAGGTNTDVERYYIDSNVCISCGACLQTCPVEAIKEGQYSYIIDQSECVNCGTCEDSCPTAAIKR